jgi:hypothetical protein
VVFLHGEARVGDLVPACITGVNGSVHLDAAPSAGQQLS